MLEICSSKQPFVAEPKITVIELTIAILWQDFASVYAKAKIRKNLKYYNFKVARFLFKICEEKRSQKKLLAMVAVMLLLFQCVRSIVCVSEKCLIIQLMF